MVKNTVTINGKRYVCRIYDAGFGFADRYTIAFKGYRDSRGRMVYPYIAANSNPFHPLGIGLHMESREYVDGKHLGKRIDLQEAPEEVQRIIRNYLTIK